MMIGRLWSLVQKEARAPFLALFVMVCLGGFIELLGISATAELMGLVASKGEMVGKGPLTSLLRQSNTTDPTDRLKYGLFWTIGILGFVHAYSIAKTFLRAQFVWLQDKQISTKIFQSCLLRPYAWFLQRNTGEIHRVLGSGHFIKGLLSALLSTAGNVAVASTLLAALFWTEPRVALIGVTIVVCAYGVVRFYTKKSLGEKGRDAHYHETARRVSAQEALTSIRFLKTTGSEEFFVEKYAFHTDRASKGMVFHSIYVDTVRAFLEWVTFAGILSLSVYFVLQSENLETLLPRLTLYTMAGYRIIPAVQALFGLWARLKFDASYLDQIEDILNPETPLEDQRSRPVQGLETADPLVSLDNVSFRYENADRNALEGLSLTLARGRWIGVVGTTGAGKTTLLDVFSGLCTPTSGVIKVGDSPLTREVEKDWQKHLGVVPQEVILLDDSISRNVAFGVSKEEIDTALVTKVCGLAGLSALLEQLPDGLETRLGERGTRLSGGERQRVGLARALYRKPTLLLLDEATSALDQATEAKIIETLKELSHDCTMVTVAHRLSSVQPCDEIVVLEHGKLVDRGTFEKLLDSSRDFQRLALKTVSRTS
jgi:ATP-binding cassette, subfamily B, bacterial PglK